MLEYNHGIDCASRPLGPAVAAAGYGYIMRYLSAGGSAIPGKQLLADEAQSYLSAGVRLVSNWETTADMMLGGYSQGTEDANTARNYHASIGGPSSAAIYFSADFDATPAQQVAINAYLQACIDVLGLDRVGIYGGFYVCERASQKFPGIKVWQTEAWSGGQWTTTNIQQRNSLSPVFVNGCECDYNVITTPGEVGAWNGENDMDLNTPIVSLVDGKTYTVGYLLQSIDLHAYNLTEAIQSLATAVQSLNAMIGRLQ